MIFRRSFFKLFTTTKENYCLMIFHLALFFDDWFILGRGHRISNGEGSITWLINVLISKSLKFWDEVKYQNIAWII